MKVNIQDLRPTKIDVPWWRFEIKENGKLIVDGLMPNLQGLVNLNIPDR